VTRISRIADGIEEWLCKEYNGIPMFAFVFVGILAGTPLVLGLLAIKPEQPKLDPPPHPNLLVERFNEPAKVVSKQNEPEQPLPPADIDAFLAGKWRVSSIQGTPPSNALAPEALTFNRNEVLVESGETGRQKLRYSLTDHAAMSYAIDFMTGEAPDSQASYALLQVTDSNSFNLYIGRDETLRPESIASNAEESAETIRLHCTRVVER
jgi:hypothetical protein